MGRLAKYSELSVWMNGKRVGTWTRTAARAHEFRYADTWLGSPAARPISLAFPLRPSAEPYRNGVEAYFDNLLPDSHPIRERIHRRFKTESTAVFDLLQQIGRDCIGALQLLPIDAEAPDIRHITGTPLSDAAIETELSNTGVLALGQVPDDTDPFRISLAGAQEKTALLWHKNAWHRPTGATPTTHILKLPIGTLPAGIDFSTSVENEWLCAQLVHAYGLPVAPCRIETFGSKKVLVVERFDRRLSANGKFWLRLPQEDFCQATGTAPAFKYENEGGPGIRRIATILHSSQNAAEDLRLFLRAQVVFWLLAAIDGHAKNFSLFLLPGGAYRLTPLYDILSAHPVLGHREGQFAPEKVKMSMAVEGKSRHYRWAEIRACHWLETGKRCGVPDMPALLAELVETTPAVLDRVASALPKKFPAAIADSILAGVRRSAKQLAAELAT
jgi:serine/threonine-protein kinase HipA